MINIENEIFDVLALFNEKHNLFVNNNPEHKFTNEFINQYCENFIQQVFAVMFLTELINQVDVLKWDDFEQKKRTEKRFIKIATEGTQTLLKKMIEADLQKIATEGTQTLLREFPQ